MSERDPMNQELDDLRAEVEHLKRDRVERQKRSDQFRSERDKLQERLEVKQSRLDYCIKENTELIGLLSLQGWKAE